MPKTKGSAINCANRNGIKPCKFLKVMETLYRRWFVLKLCTHVKFFLSAARWRHYRAEHMSGAGAVEISAHRSHLFRQPPLTAPRPSRSRFTVFFTSRSRCAHAHSILGPALVLLHSAQWGVSRGGLLVAPKNIMPRKIYVKVKRTIFASFVTNVTHNVTGKG